MVEAVEMHTHAIGGDSELRVAEGALGAQLDLGPRRVVPLARVGLEHPEAVGGMLRRQLAIAVAGEFAGILVWPTGIPRRADELSTTESKLLAMLGSSPCAADGLMKSRIDVRALSRLIRRGFVRQASFTPTDAAHVLGDQTDLDGASAELGAELFARRRDRLGDPIAASALAVSEAAIATVVRRSAEALLAAALARDGLAADAATGPLVAAGFDKAARSTRVDIGVAVPVVGLGAPARTYYPLVADLLGSRCTVPEHADVANAIGAVVGRVQITRSVLVSAPRRGVFRVHADDPTTVYDLDEAKDLAATAACAAAMADAERAGARDIETEGQWTERSATIEDKPYFVEGRYSARASGRPKLR
jgi:N-methylhydantoinase A/oxoprolinase/acetone carboxylase beta subunit